MPAQDATNVASRPRGVALVIGNSRYRHANPLANPSNDAADVSAALRALGFEVIEGIDLGRQAMTDAIRNFSRKLESATIGIAFFAGHGLQVSGKNFLLPVDARLERADDLEAAAVDLSRIVAAMESKDRVSLIFLDACRDNPMTQPTASAKSVGRNLGSVAGGTSTSTPDVEQGLATAKGAVGTLIAYSTQPDNVALDGDGRNSPFAAALLAHIAAPRLEIETMMKQVRLDVITATQNKQNSLEPFLTRRRRIFKRPMT